MAKRTMPRRVVDGISTMDVDGELIVHDSSTRRAYHLPVRTAAVWTRCDGAHAVEAVAAELSMSAEEVETVLAELVDAHLVVRPDFAISRRKVLVGTAGVAGSAILASVTFPSVAMAASFTSLPSVSSGTGTVTPSLWVTADDIQTVQGQANNSQVTTWKDQSGTGNHLTAGGVAPTLLTGVWNGHAVVSFDGFSPNGDDNRHDYVNAPDLVGTQNMQGGNAVYDVFVVAMPTGFGGYLGWGEPQTQAGHPDGEVAFRTYNHSATGLITYWYGDDDVQPQVPVSTTGPNVLETWFDGTNRGMNFNGGQVSSGPASGKKNTVPTPPRVGSSALSSMDYTEPFNGYIAEVIIYESVLTPSQRSGITTYLTRKYGVA